MSIIKKGILPTILLTSLTFTCGIAMEEEKPKASKFPYIKNIGFIQAASGKTFTAVLLTDEFVLTAAHASCLYNPAEDQLFIQSLDYTVPLHVDPKTQKAKFEMAKTETDLQAKGILFSRYDVIYKPTKVVHEICAPKISLRDNPDDLMKELKALFDKQLHIDSVLEHDPGIDGFTYPEGDWAILKLRNPIPVEALPIEGFSGDDLSGLDAMCIGAQPKKEEELLTVSPKIMTIKPRYYNTKGVFYTSVETKGAQDDTGILELSELPKTLVTDGMGGGPVFFLKGDKWILGAIVSSNLCDRVLPQLSKVSLDETVPMEIRLNAHSIIKSFIGTPYRVYTLYQSLEGLHDKLQDY